MGDDGICSRQEKVQSQPSLLPISSVCSRLTLTLWSSQHTSLIKSALKTTCCLADAEKTPVGLSL